ncbi:unnamed protein product [Brachionus calyciflorus]|uniref:AAA+ ATPase domain-containing protein n=1 Tax=Brachionus calyciflorus TaxID=104777 RepID=A0A814BZX4_9BILA|nr:unnamed protein product [Brachionus calyciflorus]
MREFFRDLETIPFLGKIIKEKLKETHFIFDGIFKIFNKNHLECIILNCFDKTSDEDFELNINKILIDNPIEEIIDMIPFTQSLKIFSTPFKYGFKKVTKYLLENFRKNYSSGEFVILNFTVEILKSNLDLENFINIIDLEKEIKLENKFSLIWNSCYQPVEVNEETNLVLNISNDLVKNKHWFLYHLNKKSLKESQCPSKISFLFLNKIKNCYSIEKVENIRMDISDSYSTKIPPKLGARIKYVERSSLIDQINTHFQENNCVLIHGLAGTGKTTLAKEYAFRNLGNKGYCVRFFECADDVLFKNNYIEFVESLTNINIGNLFMMTKAELVNITNKRLLETDALYLFIFDNFDNINIIIDFISFMFTQQNIKIIFTTRNKNSIPNYFDINLKKIHIEFFNVEEAKEYLTIFQDDLLDDIYETICQFILKEGFILAKKLEVAIKFILNELIFDLEEVEKILSSEKLTNILNALGSFYSQVDFKLSFDYLNKELDIYKKVYGNNKENLKISNILESFAFLHQKNDNDQITLEYLLKSYEIRKKIMGKNESINLANFLMSIAFTYSRIGNFKKAYELNELAENMLNRIYSSEIHQFRTIILSNNGYHKQALTCSLESLDFHCKFFGESDHSHKAQIYELIGICYFDLDNWEKSLEYHLSQYEMLKRIYENNNPTIAQSILFISKRKCFWKLHDLDKAHEFKIQSHQIYFNFYNGSDHPNLARSYMCLSNSYLNLDDHENGLKYSLESFEMAKRLYSKNDCLIMANIICCLAKCYEKVGDFKKAYDLHFKAYEMKKRIFVNRNNLDLADSLMFLGLCFSSLNEAHKSLEYFQQAYEIQLKIWGSKDNQKLFELLLYIGSAYIPLNQLDTALRHIQLSYDMIKRIYGDSDHSFLLKCFFCFGNIFSILGNYEKALEYYLKEYEMRIRIYGYCPKSNLSQSKKNRTQSCLLTDDCIRSFVLIQIGLCFFNLNDMDKSLEYLFKSYEYESNKKLGFYLICSCYWQIKNYDQLLQFVSNELKKNSEYLSDSEIFLLCLKVMLSFSNIKKYQHIVELHLDNFETKLSLFDFDDNEEKLADTFQKFGDIYQNIGQSQKAYEYYKKEYKKRLSINTLGSITNNIHLVLKTLMFGNEKNALDFCEKAHEIIAEKLDEKNSLYWISYYYLSHCFIRFKRYQNALDSNQKAYEIITKNFDKEPIEMALIYDNFGIIYTGMHHENKPIEYFNKSIELRTKLSGNFDELENALTLLEIGKFYLTKNDDEKAFEYCTKANDIINKLYGEESDHFIKEKVLDFYAQYYVCIKDDKKAFEFKTKCFEFRKRLFKDIDSTYLALSMLTLGLSHLKLDQIDQAREYFMSSYEMLNRIYEASDNMSKAECLFCLGITNFIEHDYEKSYGYFKECYNMRKRIYKKKNDVEIYESLQSLSLCYSKRNDLKNSQDYLMRANKMKEYFLSQKISSRAIVILTDFKQLSDYKTRMFFF